MHSAMEAEGGYAVGQCELISIIKVSIRGKALNSRLLRFPKLLLEFPGVVFV